MLLIKSRVIVYKFYFPTITSGKHILFKLVNARQLQRHTFTKNLFGLIVDAGRKDVFSRDTTSKLRLNKALQPKVSKNLENKKLIKGATLTVSKIDITMERLELRQT